MRIKLLFAAIAMFAVSAIAAPPRQSRFARRHASTATAASCSTTPEKRRCGTSASTCIRRSGSPATTATAAIPIRNSATTSAARWIRSSSRIRTSARRSARTSPNSADAVIRSAAYMNRFNPAARVDMVSEYWTSHHGQKLRSGVTDVATCIDCHSVHDIRRKGNPDSPVYPTHVAETCSRCHSDPKRMGERTPSPGRSVRALEPQRSREGAAREGRPDRADLQRLPRQSRRRAARNRQRALRLRKLSCPRGGTVPRQPESRGPRSSTTSFSPRRPTASAATCHDDKRAALQFTQLSSCLVCHENHSVVRPTVAMLGELPERRARSATKASDRWPDSSPSRRRRPSTSSRCAAR